MPNIIENTLTVDGEPDKVQEFLAAIDGSENGRPGIDFEKIKPMPEALSVESGTRSRRALALYEEFTKEILGIAEALVQVGENSDDIVMNTAKQFKQLTDKYAETTKDDPELMTFGRQLFNNVRDYGAATWYDWCIQNWGTKWNASNVDLDGNTVSFETAWGGVNVLIQELSVKYPDVELTYTSIAEDGFGITCKYKCGACNESNDIIADWAVEDGEDGEGEDEL